MIAGTQTRDPSTRSDGTRRINDARLDKPETRVSRKSTCKICKKTVIRQAGIVIEEEEQLAIDLGYASISARRDSEILRQRQGLHLLRKPCRNPAIPDDDDIDLDYHMRYVVLPEPGSLQQLESLVARLHSSLLDRSRPLWEFYVIEGLAD